MVTVINTFGASEEEVKAVKSEAERLRAMGYNVPAEIEIKFLSHAYGIAGTMQRMYIHPIMDIEYLKFVVRHEIGHHNEPETEVDIWDDNNIGGYLSNEKVHQTSEDFANSFAEMTK